MVEYFPIEIDSKRLRYANMEKICHYWQLYHLQVGKFINKPLLHLAYSKFSKIINVSVVMQNNLSENAVIL